MKRCTNPFCDTECYDPDRDGTDLADYCPKCFKTTCTCCCGWHEWDNGCPFCQGKGFPNCIYDDAGPHCLGCPFQGGCNWYDEFEDDLASEVYESYLVEIFAGG